MKKILVLCDCGQVRSVAMATILRERGHFAVAGSYDNYIEVVDSIIHEETHMRLRFSTVWDKIIFMQEGGEHFIGRDDFTGCDDLRLIRKCQELAERF